MNRRATFTQNDVKRAVKGVQAAGLKIEKVIATNHGIQIVTREGTPTNDADNTWDPVLDDGT